MPDFYFGAHAAIADYRPLTRDVRRYRTCFPTIEIIAPPSSRTTQPCKQHGIRRSTSHVTCPARHMPCDQVAAGRRGGLLMKARPVRGSEPVVLSASGAGLVVLQRRSQQGVLQAPAWWPRLLACLSSRSRHLLIRAAWPAALRHYGRPAGAPVHPVAPVAAGGTVGVSWPRMRCGGRGQGW
jgi:hypothetical protein